ncbi:MAG: class I SAM-dependent RNA methyltransferase [Bacteroidetes bacterium]|nr:MAG: class I SAM-dependent RNA methyltransferase [Bacteroidota bacterium]
MIATTLHGLEPVLAGELEALGGTEVRQLKRAVSFSGDQQLLYRANYELRTALRVLVPLHSFKAHDERSFYNGVREVDWARLLTVTDTLAVHAVVAGNYFNHAKYVSLLAKDAIVDQFRDRFQRRPSVNVEAPTLRIQVRINGTRCDLLLDSSGDSLHKRGYRRDAVLAPLNEVLAAGMILLTGWKGTGSFVDPMCGSGTIPIEAAMIAMDIPPQKNRESFGFMRWADFDAATWATVRSTADARARQEHDFPILASDKDSRARNATAINLMAAGLEHVIKVEKVAFEKLEPPEIPGILVMNPPYDERLKLSESAAFYQYIGDILKKRWAGWDAWLISSNLEAWKKFGLRPSRKLTLFNGPLECYFQKFEMYAGKKHG